MAKGDVGEGVVAAGQTATVADGVERHPLLRSAAIGAPVGLAVVGVAMLVLRSMGGGSSSPSCTMERTLECMPEGIGRAFDLVLVLLAALVVSVGALLFGLLLLLISWLARRKRSEPPDRSTRVLVAVAAGFTAFGASTLAALLFLL